MILLLFARESRKVVPRVLWVLRKGLCQMWRFILVTFGFLFFAFYELSGGADYAPKDGSRQSVAAERAQAAEQKRLAFLQAKPREKAPLPVAAEVITGGDDTVVLASAGGSALPLPKPSAVTLDQAVIDVAKAENLTEVAASASTNTAFGDDIREVTGGRVNLRRGPGTNFNAVGRLTHGEQVLVLSEENGWVKLRVLETGRIGYMADFLVSDTAN